MTTVHTFRMTICLHMQRYKKYPCHHIYKHKKAPNAYALGAHVEKRRPPTLPHCIAVPSAQVGLTSLFEMGRGGTPPQ